MAAPDDEPDWIARSQLGDLAAFERLVERHQRMIHSLTYRMTGSLDEAEDLAQETFIQAFRHLGSYRAEACFSAWLCRIAMNLCLNWRKREQRRGQVHETWSQQAGTVHSVPSEDLSRRVQEALLKLPAQQRAAVVLTAYEGLSHAEAARVLGCSETTVSWRLFAARAKLRRWLKDLAPHKEREDVA